MIEKSGTRIRNIFQKNNPIKTDGCKIEDCFICTTTKIGNCRASSITYDIRCEEGCDEIYDGESSKNGYTRGKEHWQKFESKTNDSVLWKHCEDKHEGEKKRFEMRVKDRCKNSSTMRQILESVRIKGNYGKQMNRQTEWNYMPQNENNRLTSVIRK